MNRGDNSKRSHSCLAKPKIEKSRQPGKLNNDYENMIEKALALTSTVTDSINSTRIGKTEKYTNERAQKWKEFSLVIADSYDKIKLELQTLIHENAKLTQSNTELQNHNGKIKNLLRDCEAHNKNVLIAVEREAKARKTAEGALEEANKQITEMKSKITLELKSKVTLYKTIEKLKRDIDGAKERIIPSAQAFETKSTQNVDTKSCDSQAESVEYYKKLADDNMKECKSLAEQLICLRSDLDTNATQMIKAKREINNSEMILRSAQKDPLCCITVPNTEFATAIPTPLSRNAMIELGNNNCTEIKPSSEFASKAQIKTPPNYPYITCYKSNFENFQKNE
jgi:chromosome segregation ATPase